MSNVCDVPFFCGRPDCQQHGIDDPTLDPAKWAKSEFLPKMGGGAAREPLDLDIRLSLIENLKLYTPVAVLEILAEAHPNTAWSGTSASPSAGLVHFYDELTGRHVMPAIDIGAHEDPRASAASAIQILRDEADKAYEQRLYIGAHAHLYAQGKVGVAVETPARRLKCPQCFPRHGTFYNADETACWRGCGVEPVEG